MPTKRTTKAQEIESLTLNLRHIAREETELTLTITKLQARVKELRSEEKLLEEKLSTILSPKKGQPNA